MSRNRSGCNSKNVEEEAKTKKQPITRTKLPSTNPKITPIISLSEKDIAKNFNLNSSFVPLSELQLKYLTNSEVHKFPLEILKKMSDSLSIDEKEAFITYLQSNLDCAKKESTETNKAVELEYTSTREQLGGVLTKSPEIGQNYVQSNQKESDQLENNIEMLKVIFKEITLLINTPADLRELASKAVQYKRNNKANNKNESSINLDILNNFSWLAQLENNNLTDEQLELYKPTINEFILQLYTANDFRALSTQAVEAKRNRKISFRNSLLQAGLLDTSFKNKKFLDLSEAEKEKIRSAIKFLHKEGRLTTSEANNLIPLNDSIEAPNFSIQMRGWHKCNEITCQLGCNRNIPSHPPTQVIFYKKDSRRYSNVAIPDKFHI